MFRRIWISSLIANFGPLIIGVAAAWEMVEHNGNPTFVALVQTAILAPHMAFSLLAGGLADMYNRRTIMLISIVFPVVGVIGLVILSLADNAAPIPILVLCFLVGIGSALFGPAWQASVRELVSRDNLSSAIGLNAISLNIARTLGPTIGGIMVVAAGAMITFGATALLYIPLGVALLCWKWRPAARGSDAESLRIALLSGVAYAARSLNLRPLYVRVFTVAVAVSSVYALMPLIARNILAGGADLYGILLTGFGFGSVIGAAMFSELEQRFRPEIVVRGCMLIMVCATALIPNSQSQWFTIPLLGMIGMSWFIILSLLNMLVQLRSPDELVARTLGLYATLGAGGLAIGSAFWGSVASVVGVAAALTYSSVTMLLLLVVGVVWPIGPFSGCDRTIPPS